MARGPIASQKQYKSINTKYSFSIPCSCYNLETVDENESSISSDTLNEFYKKPLQFLNIKSSGQKNCDLGNKSKMMKFDMPPTRPLLFVFSEMT